MAPDPHNPVTQSGEHPVVHNATVLDPRIDRVISWILGVIATLALSIGASFWKGTQDNFAELRKDMMDMKIEVAALRQANTELADMKSQMQRLEERLRSVEIRREK